MIDDHRKEKLHRVKVRLEGLVLELDHLLREVRAVEQAGPAQDVSQDDPEWVRAIAQQREVLATVVAIIADSIVESTSSAGNS